MKSSDSIPLINSLNPKKPRKIWCPMCQTITKQAFAVLFMNIHGEHVATYGACLPCGEKMAGYSELLQTYWTDVITDRLIKRYPNLDAMLPERESPHGKS